MNISPFSTQAARRSSTPTSSAGPQPPAKKKLGYSDSIQFERKATTEPNTNNVVALPSQQPATAPKEKKSVARGIAIGLGALTVTTATAYAITIGGVFSLAGVMRNFVTVGFKDLAFQLMAVFTSGAAGSASALAASTAAGRGGYGSVNAPTERVPVWKRPFAAFKRFASEMNGAIKAGLADYAAAPTRGAAIKAMTRMGRKVGARLGQKTGGTTGSVFGGAATTMVASSALGPIAGIGLGLVASFLGAKVGRLAGVVVGGAVGTLVGALSGAFWLPYRKEIAA